MGQYKRKREGRVGRNRWFGILTILCVVQFGLIPYGLAYDVNEKLYVGGVVAGVYQYQDLSDNSVADSVGRGALVFQPEASFKPTEKDELFVKLGFAEGNALNKVSPFQLQPWAADLEDDVKDINGRNRDYLLTAWYKHTFELTQDSNVGLTGGIIDSTDYLDENVYAGDEYTQFMNQAFVVSANAFLPSYDWGGAIEFEAGNLSIKGVGMAIGSNDDGIALNYYGVQVGYRIHTRWGEGNYRFQPNITSEDFLTPEGTKKEKREAFIFNFDQEFGDTFAGFLRIILQDDKAVIRYESAYTGGININGKAWGRPGDNAAIAFAHLYGGNQDIDETQVAETYARFVLHNIFALTVDVQYMRDKYKVGEDIKGFIYGVRAVATF